MRCRTIARLSAIAIAVLLGVGLSPSASALFTGIDHERDAANADATADDATTPAAGTGAATDGSPAERRVADPFADTAGVTLPDDTAEAVVRRSQAWYNRPTNAKHFERLLGRTPPAEAPRATAEPKEAAEPDKTGESHGLDYVVGVITAAGVGATLVLLFRRHS